MENTNIDILFIPPINNPVFTGDYENYNPLGLLTLCSILEKNNFNGSLFRINQRLIDDNTFIKLSQEIISVRSKIIGFSTYCNSFPAALILAKTIKRLNPESIILFGGPHASLLHNEIMEKFSFVDFVLRGESDNSIVDFIKILVSNENIDEFYNVSGLSFRTPSGVVSTLYNVENIILDELPIPKYDISDFNRIADIDVGRGCPFECIYCCTNNFFSRKYRVKSINRIITEINYFFRNYNITAFSFAHDMFTLNRNFIVSFCESFIEYQKTHKIKFSWSCSARIDCVSEDMLDIMSRAGCKGIFFGIESGSDKIQKYIRKNLKLETIQRKVDFCLSVGILPTVSFMAGFPTEDEDDLNESLKMILKLSASKASVQLSLLSILPGTDLFKEYKTNLNYDGDLSDFSGVILSDEEEALIKENVDLFSSFYYLPIKSIRRELLVLIPSIVNKLNYFSNTLSFLIENENTLININPIKELNNFFQRLEIENKLGDDNQVLIEIIKILQCLIKKYHSNNKYLNDLLYFEAMIAINKRKFIRYQLIYPRNKFVKKVLIYNVSPYWDLIESDYDFNNLLSIKIKSIVHKSYPQKRKYLIIAQNEKECSTLELNDNQFNYLKDLKSKDLFIVDEFSGFFSDEDSHSFFIKKLIKIGVLI